MRRRTLRLAVSRLLDRLLGRERLDHPDMDWPWMTVDEVRARQNLPNIPGGDRLLMTPLREVIR